MQTIMARAGRKRNPRMHLSSVGLKIDYRALSFDQPHRRVLPIDMRSSEKAETPFGCLNLLGAVSDEQFEAGRLYRIAVQEYGSSIGVPVGDGVGGRGYPCKGDPRCGIGEPGKPEPLPCECRRRKIAYNQAFEALAPAGHKAQVQVGHVAVHGRGCNDLKELRRGLDLLVRHFGVGRRK